MSPPSPQAKTVSSSFCLSLLQGRLAACNLASEGLSSVSTTPDQAQRKLYVGGLSPETTTEMLLNFFLRHGEIEEGSVAYDKDTNKSRYYLLPSVPMQASQTPILHLCFFVLFLRIFFICVCSGFGFVTYKTVEAAKKALDDPERTLGVGDLWAFLSLLC